MARIRSDQITPAGKEILSWLKHWRIASAIADEAAGGALTDEAKAEEKRVLSTLRRMIRAKYLTKEARRVRARWGR